MPKPITLLTYLLLRISMHLVVSDPMKPAKCTGLQYVHLLNFPLLPVLLVQNRMLQHSTFYILRLQCSACSIDRAV